MFTTSATHLARRWTAHSLVSLLVGLAGLLPLRAATVTLSDKFPIYSATDPGPCMNAGGGPWQTCGATGHLAFSGTQRITDFFDPTGFHGTVGEENFLLAFTNWNTTTQAGAWTLNEVAPLSNITYDITNFTTRASASDAGVQIHIDVETGNNYTGPPLDQLVWIQAVLLNYRFQDPAGTNVPPYTTLDSYSLSKDSDVDPAFKVACAPIPASPNRNTPSSIPATPEDKAYCDPIFAFQYADKHFNDEPTGFYPMDSFRAEAFLATINTLSKTVTVYDGGVNYGFDVWVAPEPGTWCLMGLGIAGCALRAAARVRKRRSLARSAQ